MQRFTNNKLTLTLAILGFRDLLNIFHLRAMLNYSYTPGNLMRKKGINSINASIECYFPLIKNDASCCFSRNS